MKIKSVIRKRLIIIVICVLVVSFLYTIVPTLRCETIDDYANDLEQVKKEQRENITKLIGVQKQIAQVMYDMTELDEKMNKYTSDLTVLQSKVDSVNQKTQNYENILSDSSSAYEELQKKYFLRIRKIYENGFPTIFDMIASSQGIRELFTRITVYTSILEYDKSLLGNVKSKKDYVTNVKKDLEVQKVQLEKLKKDTEQAAKILDDARVAKDEKMKSLQSSQETLVIANEALAKQEEEALKKIEIEIENIRKATLQAAQSGQTTPTFTGGDFEWPTPGFFIITTKFNISYDPWNSGKSTVHTGVDVAGAGIFGTPLVAIADGVVSLSKYYGGYGNCVIINHGINQSDGASYITLYGHASTLLVNQGDRVTKGQTVALVGSTGNSTGPHLHYELYKDGTRIDPLSCYPALSFKFY